MIEPLWRFFFHGLSFADRWLADQYMTQGWVRSRERHEAEMIQRRHP